jgi:hypothetical protein
MRREVSFTYETLVQICTSTRRRIPENAETYIYSRKSDWQRVDRYTKPVGVMRYSAVVRWMCGHMVQTLLFVIPSSCVLKI